MVEGLEIMNSIESEVKQLLESDITAYRIAKDTGIPESTVKKLRNQNQKIENTKYEFIGKLYEYAMLNKDVIREGKLSEIKLPKAVSQFIENIDKQVQRINRVGAIRRVYVYNTYYMNEDRNSEEVNTFVEINETIGLPLRWDYTDATPYQIHIKKGIKSGKDIHSIRGLTVVFNKNELIRDLKIHIQNGYKVKIKGESDKKSLVWSKAKNRGIYISDILNHQEHFNYESSYFDIRFNDEIEAGNFPLSLIENVEGRNLLGSAMSNAPSKTTVLIGESDDDEPITIDLEKEPHMLIGGNIGSGITASLNFIIASLLWHSNPNHLQTAFIDITGSAFMKYQNNPFNMNPVIDDIDDAKDFIKKLCEILRHRFDILKTQQCNNIKQYNEQLKHGTDSPNTASVLTSDVVMKRIVVFIRYAGKLINNDKDMIVNLKLLTELGKLVGIHIIYSEDDFNVSDSIPGTHMNSIRNRISYKTDNAMNSKAILGIDGAESLTEKGQALVSNDKQYNCELVQTPYISDEEIENIIAYINQNLIVEGVE